MRFKNSLLAAAALIICALGLGAQDNSENKLWPDITRPAETDATCRKLIDLNLQARGGSDALEAIRNIRFEGTLVEGKSDYRLSSLQARPDLIRREISRRHIGRDYLTIELSSGTDSWYRDVLPEKELPREITGLDEQLLDLEARIPFFFMPEVIEDSTFAYRGEVSYADQSAYLIHGWLPTGLEIDIHIDARSFHILNYRIPMRIGGQTVLVDRTPVGLQRAGGIWWERGHKIHIRAKVTRELSWEGIALNVDIGQAAFSKPATKEYWLRP